MRNREAALFTLPAALEMNLGYARILLNGWRFATLKHIQKNALSQAKHVRTGAVVF